jgi:hypothetical protein
MFFYYLLKETASRFEARNYQAGDPYYSDLPIKLFGAGIIF